jgi:large subunit ribosomal protein L20
MPRVKGGYATKRRRNRLLKLAKGYFGAKHILFKTAKEQVMNSLAYAYRDRRRKKRDFRKLWITRINAGARLHELTYSKLIHGLAVAKIEVNRKILADLAVNDPKGFGNLCDQAKKALAKAAE